MASKDKEAHRRHSREYRDRQRQEREAMRQLANDLLTKEKPPQLVQLATAALPRFHQLRQEQIKKVEQGVIDAAHADALLMENTRSVLDILDRRLDENQREMSRWFESVKPKGRRVVANASRQLGKSWWAVNLALGLCITTPRAQVKYGAPSKIQTRGIVMPHIRAMLEGDPEKGLPGIPKEFHPTWIQEDSHFLFKHNGATLTIIACDEAKADSITGQAAHLFLIDEAGQIDNLDFIVRSIARPMLQNTRGHMLIFSTPARSKGNSFKSYCDEAKERGLYLHRDIYDNPRLTDEEIREECRDAGGVDSTTWKREYLCEHVTDEETAVLPGATAERLNAITLSDEVLKATRSSFVDPYLVVKPRWNPNQTGALLAHFDYRLKRIVIENELTMKQLDSARLHQGLSEKTLESWGENPKIFKQVMAPADEKGTVDEQLLVETHGFGWKFSSPPRKATDVDINRLRHSILHVRGPKLFIHERCTATRRQFENAVWNEKRTHFEASREDGLYELVSSGIHLRQAIMEKHDPTPKHMALNPAVGITIPLHDGGKHGKLVQSVKKLLRVR